MLAGEALVHRDEARIARGGNPVGVGLSMVTEGAATLMYGGREIQLEAGDLCLVSSAVPFEKRVSPGYREHFYLALHEPIVSRSGLPLAYAPRVVQTHGGFARVLGLQVATLAQQPLHDAEVAASLFAATQNLIGAVFAEAPPRELLRETARELRRRQVLACIAEGFRDPDLDPSAVAQRCRISLRYLHGLFAGEASVSQRILAYRLEHCRQRLADRAQLHTTIGEIAFDAGFNNIAHFCRTFKARFGMTPSEARG